MNDDFLHRLRKPPRPEFAARLRSQLRRQSLSPPEPKAPSRARTLFTLLLLGGTAFALTSVAMRGLPPSLLALYQHTVARIGTQRTAPVHPADNTATAEGLRWGGSGYSPAHGAGAGGGGAAQSASQAVSAQSAAGTSSSAASARPSAAGGAPSGPGAPQINVLASWSAYPYVTAMLQGMNISYPFPHIDVSVRDSDSWPGPLCSSGSQAPDLAYAFEPAGTVINTPCPSDAGNKPASVRATTIGYEAVVVARSPLYGELDVTRREMFLALAKTVPDPARAGKFVLNTSTTWRQVDPALGPERIEIFGPPLDSPAGRSMIELLMEGGCDTYPWVAALKWSHPRLYAGVCRTVRMDGLYGVYTEAPGLSSTRLLAEPNAVGVFSFVKWTAPFLQALSVSKLDGIEPTLETIESGAYPGSRALYFYKRSAVPRDVLFRLLPDNFDFYPDWALIYPWSFPEHVNAEVEALAP